MSPRVLLPWLLLLAAGPAFAAPETALPPGEKEPLLRLEGGGPTSFVTALAFSGDGKLLYSAGWDKVVRVWRLNERGQFVADTLSYRVPIGPGIEGQLNALALSEDGNLLAVGGMGVIRGGAGFRQRGWVLPALSGLTDERRRDQGLIYVFDTRTGKLVHLLRGSPGPVQALTFAPPHQGKPNLLASASYEWNAAASRNEGMLRLWNVDRESPLASISVRPGTKIPPALAVWHGGDAIDALHVAVSWDDRVFRIWDTDRKEDSLRPAKDVAYNRTAAHVADDKVLTAAYGRGGIKLKLWDASGNKPPRPVLESPEPTGEHFLVPQALCLASKKGDGRLDLAVTASARQVGDRAEDVRLQLLDLTSDDWGTVRAEQTLWQVGTVLKRPVVAAAPLGKHVAVAGNDGHEILVYAVRDLLNGKDAVQRLRSAGLTARHAAFVRQDGKLGVLLGRERRDTADEIRASDLIFDLSDPQLTAYRRGWKVDAPELGDWSVDRARDGDRLTLTVREGTQEKGKVRLPKQCSATAFALLPPLPPLKVPLLAVARLDENAQTELVLYNAATGEEVRHLTAHTDPIFRVAFSSDGRFLVSVGEDQIACIWSLVDLGKMLDRNGQIVGLSVKDEQGSIAVGEVQEDSPAHDKLLPRDTIEGIVENGQVRPLPSAIAFQEALLSVKPGQMVILQVRGKQGARQVTVRVGQAIDERKPLLSLFVTRSGKAEERQWLAWSPLGVYEASDRKAEEFFGWHTNTGERANPTNFATAEKYRNAFRRKGVIQNAIRDGKLTSLPPVSYPAPRPSLVIVAEDGSVPERDRDRQFLVRQPRPTVRVDVGRPFPTLDALTWQVDNQPRQEVAPDAVPAEGLALQLALTRGVHRVRLVARTPEAGTEEFSEEVQIRYQPPAPRVEYRGERRLTVDRAEFTLQARIHPGLAGEDVTLRLTQRKGDKVVSLPGSGTQTIDPTTPLDLRTPIQLQIGYNLIEVAAVNKNALSGYEAAESESQKIEIILIEKASPPQVILDSLVLEGGRKVAIEPGETVVIHSPKATLVGTIQSDKEDLKSVEYIRDKTTVRPAGFEPDKSARLAVREILDFPEPDRPLVVRVRARTATSDLAEKTVTIVYRPEAPGVDLIAPAHGDVLLGEDETRPVRVEGRLHLRPDRKPYTARVMLDDRELIVEPVERAGTLTAVVPLHPGENRLRIVIRNAWEGRSSSDEVQVRYLRPPHEIRIALPKETQQPRLDVPLRVRSAEPPLSETVEVRVNGLRRSVKVAVAPVTSDRGTWAVTLREVPLEEGHNQLQVWMSNREARSRTPGTADIVYKPSIPVPVAEIIEPSDGTTVNSAKVKVRVHITSGRPLTKVQLTREGGAAIPLDTTTVRANAKQVYELDQTLEVTLKPGPNHLVLEAANEGAAPPVGVLVSYVPRPVHLELDALVPRGPRGLPGQPLPGERRPGGEFVVPTAPQGRVTVQGRVVWDEDDERLAQVSRVQVYVNGFQQPAAELHPPVPGKHERTFEADLLLNQPENNRVQVLLGGLPLDAASRGRLLVRRCTQPELKQRLHVLIVSVKEADDDSLEKELLDAFRSSATIGRPPAFDEVIPYGPLTGYRARRDSIRTQLAMIQARIRQKTREKAGGNDVVVFFYQGGETINPEGNFLETGLLPTAGAGRSLMPCDEVLQFFADTAGAHVFFFDVNRDVRLDEKARDKIAHWEENYPDLRLHVGATRFAWRGATPENVRLRKALQEALAHAARLEDVFQEVRTFAEAPDRKSTVANDQYLADEMKDIVVRTKP